jgi:uncharacterized protein
MRQTLAILRDLQELDTEIWRLRREQQRIPAERARRRGGLDAKRQRLIELDAEIRHQKAVVKEVEDSTTQNRQRLRKLEHESANSRADQALLAAYGHEMRNLRRDISDAEEEGLREVEKSEAKQKDRDALAAEIEAEAADFAKLDAALAKEEAEVAGKLEGLMADRKRRMGAGVPPDVLGQYERLLEARDGVALAMLDGRTCQGCYIAVPTNIYVRLSRGQEVVACPNCQRILYLPG